MATKSTKPNIDTKSLQKAALKFPSPDEEGLLEKDEILLRVIEALRLVEVVEQFDKILSDYEELIKSELEGTRQYAPKMKEISKARELLKNLYE